MTGPEYTAAREAFLKAAARFNGSIDETDYFCSDVDPYRYLVLSIPAGNAAGDEYQLLAMVTFYRDTHLTFNGETFTLRCSRPLVGDELAAVPVTGSFARPATTTSYRPVSP